MPLILLVISALAYGYFVWQDPVLGKMVGLVYLIFGGFFAVVTFLAIAIWRSTKTWYGTAFFAIIMIWFLSLLENTRYADLYLDFMPQEPVIQKIMFVWSTKLADDSILVTYKPIDNFARSYRVEYSVKENGVDVNNYSNHIEWIYNDNPIEFMVNRDISSNYEITMTIRFVEWWDVIHESSMNVKPRQTQACKVDKQCELPASYAVRSDGIWEAKCVNNQCKIVNLSLENQEPELGSGQNLEE